MEFKIKAEVYSDRIEIHHSMMDEITTEVVNMRNQIKDRAIRDWLIKEGWTPPEGKPNG